MKPITLAGALALAAALLPAAALADDPHDPLLSRSAAARERDRQEIRRLNLNELAHVRKRDAGYARERERYERDLADWRRAVAECRAGNHSACAR